MIDALTRILASDDAGPLVLSYQCLLADEQVRRAMLRPTLGQYRRFLERFRDGCVYARGAYGPQATPSALRYGSTLTYRDGTVKAEFIFYTRTRDSIVLSRRRVAARCALYDRPDTMMVSPHVPDLYIAPADLTFLDAVEECYHRYQIHGLGLPPDVYPDGPFPLEDDIGLVWRRAIENQRMRVLPIAPAS